MGWNIVKELIAKAITIGIMAIGGALASGVPIENGWVLGTVFSYAVWTQVIVPRINQAFEEEGMTAVGNTKSSFELI